MRSDGGLRPESGLTVGIRTLCRSERAQGAKRLIYDVQSPVRPRGRSYVFEYKTIGAPKLIMVWHPEQMDFSRMGPAGKSNLIPYHFYFHPTPGATVAYPYGKDAKGDQPYVGVGYRHLMSESWASVQHYYAQKQVVFVVPVGSRDHKFGEAGSSLGIFNLLKEINLALHLVNNADITNFMAQDVGRVAVSAFSAGAESMISALTDRSSPTGQSFVQNQIKEIYSWDGAIGGVIGGRIIPNTVPQTFGKLIQGWWRSEDQIFRVYTGNSDYDTHLAFLDKFAQRRDGPAGSYVKSYNKNRNNFGTLVVLQGGFFRNNYKKRAKLLLEHPLKIYQGQEDYPTDPGFPAYVDAHHWFFKVFMYHALTKGRFPDFPK